MVQCLPTLDIYLSIYSNKLLVSNPSFIGNYPVSNIYKQISLKKKVLNIKTSLYSLDPFNTTTQNIRSMARMLYPFNITTQNSRLMTWPLYPFNTTTSNTRLMTRTLHPFINNSPQNKVNDFHSLSNKKNKYNLICISCSNFKYNLLISAVYIEQH